MNRKGLIEYLRAVSAAEKGIEFCREAIGAIDTEVNSLQAYQPEQRCYQDYATLANQATKQTSQRNTTAAIIVSSILPVILL